MQRILVTAGAGFVARGTVYHAEMLHTLIEKAIQNRGFSLVETITHCHVQYGKLNRKGSHIDMMKWQKDHAVTVEKAKKMTIEELKDKFTIGVIAEKKLPIYCEEYAKVRQRAKLSEQ